MDVYDMLFDYCLRMALIFAALFALVIVFSRIYKDE